MTRDLAYFGDMGSFSILFASSNERGGGREHEHEEHRETRGIPQRIESRTKEENS